MNTTENTLETLATELGITLTSSAPRPHVESDWLSVAYDCTLTRNGRTVWAGSYKMGLGCVDKYWNAATTRPRLSAYSTAIDVLAAAAAVALEFKVKPSLPDVLYSLLLDGSADFDASTFEQWCADYGYDTDSRAALATYEACCDTGRKLRAAFTASELSALRDAASSH